MCSGLNYGMRRGKSTARRRYLGADRRGDVPPQGAFGRSAVGCAVSGGHAGFGGYGSVAWRTERGVGAPSDRVEAECAVPEHFISQEGRDGE